MKKIFTLIAMALMAIGANAQKTTLLEFAVSETSAAADSVVFENTAGIKLNVTTVEEKNGVYGAKLVVSPDQYVDMKLSNKLNAGDNVTISFFVGSNSTADNTNGIDVYDNKKSNEGQKLATYYTQVDDKKNVVYGTYTAKGGEDRLVFYAIDGGSSVYLQGIKITTGSSTYDLDFSVLQLDTKEKAEEAIEDVVTITLSTNSTDDGSQAIWENAASKTDYSSWKFKNYPISVKYKNTQVKQFAKSSKDYFQFGNSGVIITIECSAGQYITLTPVSYNKEGGFTISGGENNADQTTGFTIPAESTDPVTVKATAETVVLTMSSGACRLGRIEIKDDATTAINTFFAPATQSPKAVKCTENGQLVVKKGNNRYNVAGALLK